MSKKIVSVLLVFMMLFAFAIPAFATSEDNAVDIVASKLWLENEETEYTVKNEGTYYEVLAADHGITYLFHVQQTDGVATLVDFSFPQQNMDFITFVAFLNGLFLKMMSLF